MKTRVLPRLFTRENSPNLFNNNTSNIMIGGQETFYRNPNKREVNDLIKYRWKQNDIDVVIVGEYDDVWSVVYKLNKNKPKKKKNVTVLFGENLTESTDADNNLMSDKYIHLDNDIQHIHIKKDGKKYSGSGILVIIKNKIDDKQYYILFRESGTSNYNDLGGKIDKTFMNDPNALFNNAVKEAREESMNLFTFSSSFNYNYTDIINPINNTYYRLYVYKLQDNNNNVKKLQHIFHRRLQHQDAKLISRDHGYGETDMLDLFDIEQTESKYEPSILYQYKNISNQYKSICNRCINGIEKVYNSDMINSISYKDINIDIDGLSRNIQNSIVV